VTILLWYNEKENVLSLKEKQNAIPSINQLTKDLYEHILLKSNQLECFEIKYE